MPDAATPFGDSLGAFDVGGRAALQSGTESFIIVARIAKWATTFLRRPQCA
jgi:hypothetical protein